MDTALALDRQADFSRDRQYRWSLSRKWGTGWRLCMVMLNPSIADEERDDPTTTFCIRWAERHGAGSYVAVNLFAAIGTDPACLKTHLDPVGSWNDQAIRNAVHEADLVIAAWGSTPRMTRRTLVQVRPAQVLRLLPDDLHCFGRTKQGDPKFPRALRRDVESVPWHDGA